MPHLISQEVPPPPQNERDFKVYVERELRSHREDLVRLSHPSEKAWGIDTPSGNSGNFWIGGFYKIPAALNDFDPAISFGDGSTSYAAHFFVVTGADTADEVTITINGVSINDLGERGAADTTTIVIPVDTTINTFFETPMKWLGDISITTTGGTAINCNYGYAKYWDNNNENFIVVGLETLWLAGADDTGFDIHLHHHKADGWTYAGAAGAIVPSPLVTMVGDHSQQGVAIEDEYGSWKRTNLETPIEGFEHEGTLVEIITTNSVPAKRVIDRGTFMLRIEQD